MVTIPPIGYGDLGDGLWHCFTHIIFDSDLVSKFPTSWHLFLGLLHTQYFQLCGCAAVRKVLRGVTRILQLSWTFTGALPARGRRLNFSRGQRFVGEELVRKNENSWDFGGYIEVATI